MNYENVECPRCGYKWYVEDPDNSLPEYCPRCYRKSVRKIKSRSSETSFVSARFVEKMGQLFAGLKEDLEKHPLIADLLVLSLGIFIMTFVIVYLFF